MTLKTSELFPPNFLPVFMHALKHTYTEYTLYGGRGSCKSSFISLLVLILLLRNPAVSAVCIRKHENTLRDSVFAQIQWAIEKLNLLDVFKCTVSPLQIIDRRTGQKIFFRGCNDPVKLKSLKTSRGYIGLLWFEESCEFTPEEMRSVKQTVMRGGADFWVFESFNPPVSRKSWKNTDLAAAKKNRLIHKSDYRTVPTQWLSESFVFEAEHLKATNERMYLNEYLGEATGTGANVFENISIREITDAEIEGFDWIYNGLDWGYYPDPLAYISMSYNAKIKTLFIFFEKYLVKYGNYEASIALMEAGAEQNARVVADSAEPKSIADFASYGWYITGARKGKGSVEYGFKWLQSLLRIVIDPRRCPLIAREFAEYEYDKDKNGEILGGYPQGQADHGMAAVRYAMEEVYRRAGL